MNGNMNRNMSRNTRRNKSRHHSRHKNRHIRSKRKDNHRHNYKKVFFSSEISTATIAERLRSSEPTKITANKIGEELKGYDFKLDDSYCTASDVEISSKELSKASDSLVYWNIRFIDNLFRSKNTESEKNRAIKNTLFQIIELCGWSVAPRFMPERVLRLLARRQSTG